MKSTKLLSMLILFLMILGLALLACNLPRSFLELEFSDYSERGREGMIVTAATELDVTLVSPEETVVRHPVLGEKKWVCEDIDGIVTLLKNTSQENFEIKMIELDTYLIYREERIPPFTLKYSLEVERDEAIIGAEGITAWNHVSWKDEGVAYPIRYSTEDDGLYGLFYSDINITTTQEETYPSIGIYTSTKQHNFFGLIHPEDNNRILFCDMVALSIPDGIVNLTQENFRDFCSGFYYECSATNP